MHSNFSYLSPVCAALLIAATPHGHLCGILDHIPLFVLVQTLASWQSPLTTWYLRELSNACGSARVLKFLTIFLMPFFCLLTSEIQRVLKTVLGKVGDSSGCNAGHMAKTQSSHANTRGLSYAVFLTIFLPPYRGMGGIPPPSHALRSLNGLWMFRGLVRSGLRAGGFSILQPLGLSLKPQIGRKPHLMLF